MKLRQTPGGTWAGTEKDYKTAMKAEGLNAKDYAGREFVEVPTSKAELMEFLTFHRVNCVNPQPMSGTVAPQTPPPSAAAGAEQTTVSTLPELFDAAPLRMQLDLAVTAIDRASERLG